MKIKNITIQGFRGFNEKQSLDFHDRLTLISAPNSCGKTSISEALEWILYGITSRVEKADSKEEYKGSYRNIHLHDSLTPFVKVVFLNNGGIEVEFQGILAEKETIQRFVNSKKVGSWPISEDLTKIPKPFILQHALKYLLLVPPKERFKGFARLLGLESLDLFLQNVLSLCTKPEAKIPDGVVRLLWKMNLLETRLYSQPTLVKISKAYKKSVAGFSDFYKALLSEGKRRLPEETKEDSIIPQLIKIRDEAAAKIFKGRIILSGFSDEEKEANQSDEKFLFSSITDTFVTKYTELAALSTVQHILEKAQFFGLGLELLKKTPVQCPFCSQKLTKSLLEHVHDEHTKLGAQRKHYTELENQRGEINELLFKVESRLASYNSRHSEKSSQLLDLKPKLDKLDAIISPKYPEQFYAVKDTISKITSVHAKFDFSYKAVIKALENVKTSVKDSTENTELIKEFSDALTEYIGKAHSYIQFILKKEPAMNEADMILKYELDSLAGTEDISVLIDLLSQLYDIKKSFEIKATLDSLKELRRSVEQYCAQKVLTAISDEFTDEVMEWYGKIKTMGDPNVHFNGFGIERTKEGDLKTRRVQIKAKSYGKELVSAVSSLSESKLNALGLCVSIATNLKGDSPFEFLIIDDPIQSWDAEHETQFIEIVRKLVECSKQVVLMSHNADWIDRVRCGLRSLNGYFYQITGYTEAGPHIAAVPWAKWIERLSEVDAICKDQTATAVKLQQAEEEIRFVVMQLVAEIYFKEKKVMRNFYNLNAQKVRKMLVECGIKSDLTDRIIQAFKTVDDSHHDKKGYVPNRERIQQYHALCHELAKYLKD